MNPHSQKEQQARIEQLLKTAESSINNMAQMIAALQQDVTALKVQLQAIAETETAIANNTTAQPPASNNTLESDPDPSIIVRQVLQKTVMVHVRSLLSTLDISDITVDAIAKSIETVTITLMADLDQITVQDVNVELDPEHVFRVILEEKTPRDAIGDPEKNIMETNYEAQLLAVDVSELLSDEYLLGDDFNKSQQAEQLILDAILHAGLADPLLSGEVPVLDIAIPITHP